EADVGLVDPHAEGDRRHHDDALLAEEPRLVRRARRRVEARVVREGGAPFAREGLSRALHARAREGVDDAGVSRVLLADETQQLLERGLLRLDPVLDVGPVEARDELTRGAEVESLDDLAARVRRRRRGEGDPRDRGPALVEDG